MLKPPFRGHKYALLFVIALSLVGMMTLMFSTMKWGVGISPDSITYISIARSLLDGESVHTTHFPPGFPWLLAMIGVLGVDPVNGARATNMLLFGANIFLVGYAVNRYTQSLLLSTYGAFLVLSSVDMLHVHSMAWTEPLFIFLGFTGFLLLAAFIENSSRFLLLISAGAMGLAFLVRYSGVALIVTGAIAILLFSKDEGGKKTIASAIFTTLSCLPLTLWLIRNLSMLGRATDRTLVWHPVTLTHLKSALGVTSLWILPERVPVGVRSVLLLMVGMVFLVLLVVSRRLTTKPAVRHLASLPPIWATFIAIYFGFLICSISLFDVATPLDDRILSPVYVVGVALVLCVSQSALGLVKDKRVSQIALILLCLIFSAACIRRANAWVVNMYNNGAEYASRTWVESQTIQKIRELPANIPLYSNLPYAITFLTQRPAYIIPIKIHYTTGIANEEYLAQLAVMREQLESNSGVIVYFDNAGQDFLPSAQELVEQLPLRVIENLPDGTIYASRENDSSP